MNPFDTFERDRENEKTDIELDEMCEWCEYGESECECPDYIQDMKKAYKDFTTAAMNILNRYEQNQVSIIRSCKKIFESYD